MDLIQSGGYDQVNLVKLQDFKKKIFVIGVYDDPMEAMVERPEGDRELKLF